MPIPIRKISNEEWNSNHERKRYAPMQPVTLRLPADLIDALNQATLDYGRPSASDMARFILRRYLIEHGYEIGTA